ncbi:SDR family oxidoreductase [Sneathiella sp.]|jgi:dTDP-4-dehydrorhamnose reductase|uniref:SDR family oxidoreductase n=1 Tax=Sneathiella sp. TaxID=1964365 RepID=UPI0039E25C7C
MVTSLFCFGFGYTAGEIARLQPDWRIRGTTRSLTASPNKKEGVPLLQFDGQAPIAGFLEIAQDVSHILISVPPGEDGDPVYRVMGELLCRLPNLKWVGYLSTTGVYGDLGGGAATEETPCNPSGIRGQRRLDAERAWTRLYQKQGLPVHIFRLPGIYGPGRNQLVSLKAGKAHRIVKEGHVFSRIHVHDLARILIASMEKPHPGTVYNVADEYAAPPQDVVTYAAELLGIDPPPYQDFDTAEMSAMARSFYSDSKTIVNKKIKEELGISFKYPTYKEGLKSLSGDA